ncbi:MAG: DUF1573 domain-containing protein [Thermoanaerobaculia bacterium]
MFFFETRRRQACSNPRPALSSAALLLLLAVPLTASEPTAPQAVSTPTPKLVVAERVHETGEVARDRVIEHAFKLTNAGNAPLTIQHLILPPNLEVLRKPTVLAPGESGEIAVRVQLLNDRAVALLKQIELQTDDPAMPSVVLELKILSTEYVASKPGYARWISVQHEGPGTISQLIAAVDKTEIEVLRISPLPEGIVSKLSTVKEPTGGPQLWKLDLTLGEEAPVGAIIGTLLVYVNHPKQSIVPIPLSGFMRPVAAVTPNLLSFGEVEFPVKKSQAFTVKSYSTAPIHVTKVEHDLAGFPQPSVETRVLGREYRIKIDFDPATMPKGPVRGKMTIHTDNKWMPLLTVPIEGTIK